MQLQVVDYQIVIVELVLQKRSKPNSRSRALHFL